jgi:peptidyl-prolyl cis-trans isomerase C
MGDLCQPASYLRRLLIPVIAVVLVADPVSGQGEENSNPPAPYQPGEALQSPSDPVVAIVDGRQLHLSQLGDLIQELPVSQRTFPFESLYPSLLRDLIEHTALEQKARRLHLDEDPVVMRKMRAAAARVLEQALLEQIQREKVTEGAVRKLYGELYGGKTAVDQIRIRLILLGSERDAITALARLKEGEDFATVAHAMSRDPSSVRGGDLGSLRREQLQPNVAAAAFSLAPGEATPQPIRIAAGWCIIKVEERASAAPPSFEAAHEELRRILVRQTIRNAAAAARAESSVKAFNMDGSRVTDGSTDVSPDFPPMPND